MCHEILEALADRRRVHIAVGGHGADCAVGD